MPSLSIHLPYIYTTHVSLPSAQTNYDVSPHLVRIQPISQSSHCARRSFRQTGGKGTPRRKVVKKSQAASQGDDRKLQAALKKLNVTAVAGVEEVNMFKDDGNVLHFASPRGESEFYPFVVGPAGRMGTEEA